jgi:anthranilate phosphoribosyltransferase
LIKSALSLEPGEGAERARSMIALNAGAAIYVSGVAKTLKAGIIAADDAITSGAALDKLDAFVGFTKQLRTQAS